MRNPNNKSRSRNKNNRRNNNSGGNALNRVYDSSGPDGRVRGTPQQVIEKYQSLAHDSSLSGDRVAMENFQQHAEHYIRLTNEAQRQIAERREAMKQQQQDRQGNNQNANNGGGNQQNAPRNDATAVQDPGAGDQPAIPAPDIQKDVPFAEPAAKIDGDDGGLVETPETAAEAKRKPASRSRKPRPKKPEQSETPPASDLPAAE